MNPVLLLIHVALICSLTLIALRLGKEVMIAWLSLLAVAMNLFVLKQINLFGLDVTATDAYGVGYLLGLNLIQEYFGRNTARKCVWISLFIASSFLLLSLVHLFYIPNGFDTSQAHFSAILSPMPRIIAASLFSFLLIQMIDLSFFSFLRDKTSGKFLTLRLAAALILSQTLDTVLFSFLGLYGLVGSVTDIICLSLVVKIAVICLSSPFVLLSKRVVTRAV